METLLRIWNGYIEPAAVIVAVVAGLSLLALLFRTGAVLEGRQNGTYNPELYHRYPRFPWRTLTWPLWKYRDARRRSVGSRHGSGFASRAEVLRHMFIPGDLLVGRLLFYGFRWLPEFGGLMPVGVRTKRHLCIVAGTGSGKTTTLISMLALYPGNAFVIDPKGQIASALLNRCGTGGGGIVGKGGRAVLLDPTGIVEGKASSQWNPFEELHAVERAHGKAAVANLAKKMADALIEDDSQKEPFFAIASRQLITAMLLHIYSTEPVERHTLSRLSDLLYSPTLAGGDASEAEIATSLDFLIHEMSQNQAFDGEVRKAVVLLQQAMREGKYAGVVGTAYSQMGWISQVAPISGHSDFQLLELKTGRLTLFLTATTTDLSGRLKPWFRLLTTMAHQAFELDGVKALEHRTLFVIDEMPSLGKIDVIASSFKVMRDYGMLLVSITQDFKSLAEHYGAAAAGFRDNSDILWMGPGTARQGGESSDVDELVSEIDHVASASELKRWLAPRESGGNLILTRKDGSRPMVLRTPHYFKELPVHFYEARLDKPEAGARARTRARLTKPAQPRAAAPAASQPTDTTQVEIASVTPIARRRLGRWKVVGIVGLAVVVGGGGVYARFKAGILRETTEARVALTTAVASVEATGSRKNLHFQAMRRADAAISHVWWKPARKSGLRLELAEIAGKLDDEIAASWYLGASLVEFDVESNNLVELARSIVEYNPRTSEWQWSQLIRVLRAAGEYWRDEMETELRAMIRAGADQREAYRGEMWLCYAAGTAARVGDLRAMELAMLSLPNDELPDAWWYAAQAHIENADVSAALSVVNNTRRFSAVQLLIDIARLQRETGAISAADATVAEAMKIASGSVYDWVAVGEYAHDAGDFKRAKEADAQIVAAINAGTKMDERALVQLGEFRLYRNDVAGLEWVLSRIADSDDVQTKSVIAVIHARCGRTYEARQIVEQMRGVWQSIAARDVAEDFAKRGEFEAAYRFAQTFGSGFRGLAKYEASKDLKAAIRRAEAESDVHASIDLWFGICDALVEQHKRAKRQAAIPLSATSESGRSHQTNSGSSASVANVPDATATYSSPRPVRSNDSDITDESTFGVTSGALFKPEEVDLYIDKSKLTAHLFHAKSIDYSQIAAMVYHDVKRQMNVIYKDGRRLDLGVVIDNKLRPWWRRADAVTLARTADGRTNESVTVPLHKIAYAGPSVEEMKVQAIARKWTPEERKANELAEQDRDAARATPFQSAPDVVGSLFSPAELDIYVDRAQVEAFIFHGKHVDYDSLERLEYDCKENWVAVVLKDGRRLDLGVHIQWLIRPTWQHAPEVHLVRTENGESVEQTVVPIRKVNCDFRDTTSVNP